MQPAYQCATFIAMTPEEAVERVRAGARIRELRQAKGLVAQALATEIGCSKGHLLNIEAGRSRASDETREAIARVLGVEVEELAVAS